jgi:predicted Zn-dependent protease
MAKLAIQLEKLPHVWDTLAESYYVNGMHQEAVETSRQALALAGKKRTYYQDQLDKFTKAGAD